jgi:hypothetical protein
MVMHTTMTLVIPLPDASFHDTHFQVRRFTIPTARCAVAQYSFPLALFHDTLFQALHFRLPPPRIPFLQYGSPGAVLPKSDAWKYMFPSRRSGSSNATQCVGRHSLVLLILSKVDLDVYCQSKSKCKCINGCDCNLGTSPTIT